MTVSRALRNDAKVAEATRQAVLAAAEAAGYRLEPKIGQLMLHLRSVRARPTSEPLALVWPDCALREREESPSLAGIARGVRMRAEALGFSVDEYFLKEPGMTAARLYRTNSARSANHAVRQARSE
jgi:LacI family transcriptional regulator